MAFSLDYQNSKWHECDRFFRYLRYLSQIPASVAATLKENHKNPFNETFFALPLHQKKTKGTMKKIFMILCMALISVGAFAEKGDIYVGVDGKYYTGEKSNMGLGAKLQWQCLKHIRLEGNTSYFFESDDSRYIFAKANAHFLINLGKDNFNFYPLAGVVYRNEKYDYTTNETKGGISNSSTVNKTQTKTDNAVNVLVGAGFECPISKKVKFNVECDYIYMDYVTLSVGLAVKL